MCIRDSTKTKEILDIPIYEGGTDFPKNHDIELRNVRDVYKRQDAGRTRPERPDYQGTESAARRIADLEREVKQREQNREHSSLKAVSYTHLDVYKRQE